MRRAPLLLLIAACAAAVPAAAPAQSTSDRTGRSFAARDFTGLALSGPDQVRLRTGTGYSVHAQGPAEVLDHLVVTVRQGTLSVSRRPGGPRRGTARLLVTAPAIRAVRISGSGGVSLDRAADGLSAEVQGSGSLRVDSIAGDAARLAVRGSGSIHAAGSVTRLQVSVGGSGDIAASGLRARSADVTLAGSGSARAAVIGDARVALSGSGRVDLGPRARCRASRSGSGRLRCGG